MDRKFPILRKSSNFSRHLSVKELILSLIELVRALYKWTLAIKLRLHGWHWNWHYFSRSVLFTSSRGRAVQSTSKLWVGQIGSRRSKGCFLLRSSVTNSLHFLPCYFSTEVLSNYYSFLREVRYLLAFVCRKQTENCLQAQVRNWFKDVKRNLWKEGERENKILFLIISVPSRFNSLLSAVFASFKAEHISVSSCN